MLGRQCLEGRLLLLAFSSVYSLTVVSSHCMNIVSHWFVDACNINHIFFPNDLQFLHSAEPIAFCGPVNPVTIHIYRQTSNLRRILVDYKIVDHSDVVGAATHGFRGFDDTSFIDEHLYA